MRDIVKAQIGSKEFVVACRNCGRTPMIMEHKKTGEFGIQCSCGKRSQLYSWSGKSDWQGYNPIKMALTDWNHKNSA